MDNDISTEILFKESFEKLRIPNTLLEEDDVPTIKIVVEIE